ncbi:MAG: lytic transglycosylase domain-containing protein [Candidatus Moraniibacteriota bacterium]
MKEVNLKNQIENNAKRNTMTDRQFNAQEKRMDRRKFMQLLAVTGLSAGATGIVEKNTKLIKNLLHQKNNESTIADKQKEEISNNIENNFGFQEKEESQENKHPIGEQVLEAYNSLPEEYFPENLFKKDLLIAQQIQESGYNPTAHSHANAVGVMQNREISLKDVFNYVNYLNGKGIVQYSGPGNEDLSAEDYNNLMNTLKKNPDYSRAFGKLYLSQLLNQYKIGKEDYENGNLKEAQRMILAAYNAGPTKIKKLGKQENLWPKESRDYYKKIFSYEEKLTHIRKILQEEKILLEKPIEDYFVKELALKINSVKSNLGQRSLMVKYLKRLKKNYRNNRKIAYGEINDIFA